MESHRKVHDVVRIDLVWAYIGLPSPIGLAPILYSRREVVHHIERIAYISRQRFFKHLDLMDLRVLFNVCTHRQNNDLCEVTISNAENIYYNNEL